MSGLAWIAAGILAWLGLSLWFMWPILREVRRIRARQHAIDLLSAGVALRPEAGGGDRSLRR